jgi:hypothetical protein
MRGVGGEEFWWNDGVVVGHVAIVYVVFASAGIVGGADAVAAALWEEGIG